jgi:ADP-heptose:LPS heptosyltransferase
MDFKTPVIVSRTDRLGDLILSLPVLWYLQQNGFSEIYLRVSGYTQDIAQLAMENGLCRGFILAGHEKNWAQILKNQEDEKKSLGLFLEHRQSARKVVRDLNLQWSMGPRTHLSALWSYTYSVSQHRSRCEKSEMEYNLDLAKVFLIKCGIEPKLNSKLLGPLIVPKDWQCPVDSPEIVIVLSTKGSAANLPADFYFNLAREELKLGHKVDFLVAGTQAQEIKSKVAQEFVPELARGFVRLVGDFARIRDLVSYLSRAEKVISPSTGPLHMAYALGVRVLGFYPGYSSKTRTQIFKRWRPAGFHHQNPIEFVEF